MQPDRQSGQAPATRVVLEGEDALEDAAKLLSSKAKEAAPQDDAPAGGESEGLRAFAEALRAGGGALAGTLEELSRSLKRQGREGLFARMRDLQRRSPDAFIAGALAGYALGLLAGDAGEEAGADLAGKAEAGDFGGGFASDGDSVYPGPGEPEAGRPGVVSPPAGNVQTGPGGLGYLEPAEPGDEEKT